MDTRQRILDVTANLLQGAPGVPVSTRAICEAAGVSAPTLYHHFGDRDGLYDAVVAQSFESYLAAKRAMAFSDDPVEDLRRGWDAHIEFGVSNPSLYTLMYGTSHMRAKPTAAIEARSLLTGLLTRVAQAGRLSVDLDLAVGSVEAASVGVTLQLIRDGDNHVLSEQLREAVLASILTEPPRQPARGTIASVATQLAALLADQTDGETGDTTSGAPAESPLSTGERIVLAEWLHLLSHRGGPTAGSRRRTVG
ncbi:TetR/AcrR family transcriptional regulator [Streptomyces sp. NPDC020801]|uniref:TetR/AcrR family transcriptional regulator n=1 Tax=unclassified Streptomyces TaxID=2593676 RepID=UPI0037B00B58